MKQLTPQRDLFARVVAGGLSQAAAYRQAYPKSLKWTDNAVYVAASKLMADPKVAQRVAELAQAVEKEFAIETAGLLREALRLATSDIRKVVKDGKVLLPDELDEDTARAVASFEIDEFGRIKYKFWDKNSAMERLFKHKGLFELDNKQKTDPLADLLRGLSGNVIGPVAAGAQRKEGER